MKMKDESMEVIRGVGLGHLSGNTEDVGRADQLRVCGCAYLIDSLGC